MRKDSDWLHHQSGNRKQESGISVLDMAKLTPNQRKIMRVLLRKVEMSYSDLCKAVEAMPEADRIDGSELNKTLEALEEKGWLIQMGDQNITYRVNFRRKAGSRLSKSIWSALESKAKQSDKSEEPEAEDPER